MFKIIKEKNSQSTNDEERQFWTFLNLILQENSREEFAKHLGFTPEELQQNFSKLSLTSENKGDQTTSQNTQANQTSEEKIEDTNSASELFPQDSSKVNLFIFFNEISLSLIFFFFFFDFFFIKKEWS